MGKGLGLGVAAGGLGKGEAAFVQGAEQVDQGVVGFALINAGEGLGVTVEPYPEVKRLGWVARVSRGVLKQGVAQKLPLGCGPTVALMLLEKLGSAGVGQG